MTTDPKDVADKLRIAIAEKLGWTFKDVRTFEAGPKMRWWRSPGLGQQPHVDATMDGPPDYPNDPAAALLLVEHMRKEGYHYEATDSPDGGHQVTFFKWEQEDEVATAPTFPLAVCLAFAKANQLNIQ